MNELSNIAEYSVKKSRSAIYNIMKIATPIITGVLPIIYCLLMFCAYGLLIGPMVILAITIPCLLLSLHLFRRVDYDYRIVGNELFFSIVYNRRNRKELGSLDITKLEKIAPYCGNYVDEIDSECFEKVHDFSSSPSDPYVFYAVESDEDVKTKTLYLFNASEKMLKLIKLYNRRAITVYPNE